MALYFGILRLLRLASSLDVSSEGSLPSLNLTLSLLANLMTTLPCPVLRFLHLSTLSDRRYQYNLSFFIKPLSGSIDSSSLLALIKLKVHIRNTLNSAFFSYTALFYQLFKKWNTLYDDENCQRRSVILLLIYFI